MTHPIDSYPFRSQSSLETALVIDALTERFAEQALVDHTDREQADRAYRVAVLVVKDSGLGQNASSSLNSIYNTILEDTARKQGHEQITPRSQWGHENWQQFRRKEFSRLDPRIKNGAVLLWTLTSIQAQSEVKSELAILAK